MRITVEALRRAGYCASGVREWCAAHGMTVRQLLDDGLDLEARPDLAEDAFVQRLRALEGNVDGLE